MSEKFRYQAESATRSPPARIFWSESILAGPENTSKLSSSWVDLEDGPKDLTTKVYPDLKRTYIHESVLEKCDIGRNDLDKLGYVIPETDCTVFQCDRTSENGSNIVDDIDINYSPLEKIDFSQAMEDASDKFSFPSVSLEKGSGQSSFYVIPTSADNYPSESFYSVSEESMCYDDAIREPGERLAKPVPKEFYNVLTSDSLSSDLNRCLTLQKTDLIPPSSVIRRHPHFHPEFVDNASLSASKKTNSSRKASQSLSVFSDDNNESWSFCHIPTPPPELGLPDLTKKHLFPHFNSSAQQSLTDTDTSTIVKTKVMGIWNNVKYGWSVNLGVNFSKSLPIVLLGQVFRPPFTTPTNTPLTELTGPSSVPSGSMTAFKEAFHGLTWFTYRTKLPPFSAAPAPNTQAGGPSSELLTSDCGWGCTLRCTQMMLCQALHAHFLGNEWQYTPGVHTIPMVVHGCIVRWFGDGCGREGISPLSIHQMTECGHQRLGKQPGEWYTPSNAATAIRDALENGSKYMPDLERVTVYSSVNNILYVQDILDQCWTPCICKFGKIAEYVKQHKAPDLRSPVGRCYGNALRPLPHPHSTKQSPLPSHSADNLSSSSFDAADTFSSFVQVESLPCDVQQSKQYSSFDKNKSNIISRSISADDTENFHIVDRNRLSSSDSAGLNESLSDSFCAVDAPPNQKPSSGGYSKASFSQKIFGAYNPFKIGGKSSASSLSTDSSRQRQLSSGRMESGRLGGAPSRQESLEIGTLELLSPILEQERLCSDCHSWRSVVIILAVRMGGDTLNSMYESVITALLRHPLCIGLVGGKSKRAFYFVGYQEDQLLYLDPHHTQDCVPVSRCQLPPVQPYHCDSPKKLPISKLEPSATIGFYCHTRTDFAQLIVDLPKLTTVREGRMCYPLVEVKGGSRTQHESVWKGSSILEELSPSPKDSKNRLDDFQLLE